MACSHEGQVELAKSIIDSAGAADADIIQLQVWAVEYMMSPSRKEYSLLSDIELTQNEWRDVVTYSRNNHPEMSVYVCVYEHASIDFIQSLDIDGYKINSSDLSNPLVVKKVAETGKPINLSVGASTISEIQNALELIRQVSDSQITLMYGFQSFPTQIDKVNLSYVKKLGDLFELPVGYQDHCDANLADGNWLSATSIGLGATVLERHITHDRSKKGIDHESALNPDEFAEFVKMVRVVENSLGISVPRQFSKEEQQYREFQKKSIVAAVDLEEGITITDECVCFMRAEELGISPDKISNVIGRRLNKAIKAYSNIYESDLI